MPDKIGHRSDFEVLMQCWNRLLCQSAMPGAFTLGCKWSETVRAPPQSSRGIGERQWFRQISRKRRRQK